MRLIGLTCNLESFYSTVFHAGVSLLEIRTVDSRRGELLAMMKNRGALQDFVDMETAVLRIRPELDQLDSKIQELDAAILETANIKVQTAELEQSSAIGFSERQISLAPTLNCFADIIKHMYGERGQLVITPESGGYSLATKVPREGSDGVAKMDIFAYDWSVIFGMRDWRENPGFLCHDSAFFDGVDERQRATALATAFELSTATDTQYIVSMNSDQIPWGDLEPIGITEEIVNERVVAHLGDAEPENTLMGFRW